MPIYEYNCRQCDEDFELLIRSQEPPACPSCGSGQLDKLLSLPAAHSGNTRDLPVCEAPPSAGCGLPQCGAGRCAME